ncbi:unnamed protein product [Closterium sp. Yama58-4]|nr:unnamed protein product [Closterium sp. Yama58-4]
MDTEGGKMDDTRDGDEWGEGAGGAAQWEPEPAEERGKRAREGEGKAGKGKTGSKKARAMHPRNRYAENPPDFRALAEQHPALAPFVLPARRAGGPVGFMWSNYNATRELTRALLHTDFGVDWWIDHGHLCPTVPNRTNYLLWLHDLLASLPVPPHGPPPACGAQERTGADVTESALQGALANRTRNPRLAPLIDIRRAGDGGDAREGGHALGEDGSVKSDGVHAVVADGEVHGAHGADGAHGERLREENGVDDQGKGLVLRSGEEEVRLRRGVEGGCGEAFDACMCNPPFFESLQQAGANPRTACGGTAEEMVCAGGELAFIRRIVHDSCALRTRIRWAASRVGLVERLSVGVSPQTECLCLVRFPVGLILLHGEQSPHLCA